MKTYVSANFSVKILSLIFSLIINCGCHKRKVNEKILQFKSDSTIADAKGTPKDSMTQYFPQSLFNDTFKYLVCKKDTYEIEFRVDTNSFAKNYNLKKGEFHLLDSISFQRRTILPGIWSFSLFKMKEPVLYTSYLNKEIYRLIIDRSFDKLFVVHIEKNEDSIFIVSKRLNRHVRFPIIVSKTFDPDLVFNPARRRLTQAEINKHKLYNDSIDRIKNDPNYHIDSLICKRVSKKQWKDLMHKLALLKFWDSYPKIYDNPNHFDGSHWIIEGHNESGYQVHDILNPFDTHKEYSDILKYIVNLSGLNLKKRGNLEFY